MRKNGRQSRTFLSLAVLPVLLVLYVLSYAPVYRVAKPPSASFVFPERQARQAVYIPVEWAIENTAMQKPLLSWAGLWGCRNAMELECWLRVQGMDEGSHFSIIHR